MVDIPFPQTSQPGSFPGEGLGRLLNRYFELDGAIATWRLVPGLVPFADPGVVTPRGSHVVGATLFVARAQTAITVNSNGASTTLAGQLIGTLPVSWAHNNKAPDPDIVCCTQEVGALYIDPNTGVASYPDGNLPQSNSVAMLDGYLLFTTADGHIYASGVNDIWVDDADHTQNALSFTLADQSEGLIRGTVWAEQYFAWGKRACTVYTDAGTSPFPLARTAIIPVGLIGFAAITGWEPGWGMQQFFVADDCTVRRLDGYTPTVISVNDLERQLEAIVDKRTIEMSCYALGARPVVVVSAPGLTWEYNALTNLWNERESANFGRWRCSKSVNFNNRWLYGDLQSTQLLQVSSAAYDEVGTSFTARLESGPVKNYPNRGKCTAAYFDFTTAGQPLTGNPDAVTPQLSISTSKDGGGTWSNPVLRTTVQGEYNKMIRVNRIGGIFTQHGLRFRVDSSSPVYTTCRGARCDVQWMAAP
jgi:hypothetical protein